MVILKKLNNEIGNELYISIKNIREGDREASELMEKNAGKARSSYINSRPLSQSRQKWSREERIEKIKGTEQEVYDFRKIKESNRNEWEPLLIKKMDVLKKLNGGKGEPSEDVIKRFKLNNNLHQDILFKKNSDITQNEIYEARRYAWFEGEDKVLNEKLSNKIDSWYNDFYGGSSKVDATGKVVQPEAKGNISRDVVSLKTADGFDIEAGYDKIATVLADISNSSTILQKALNSYDFEPKLKEDGEIGPKTTARTKETMIADGVSKLLEKLSETASGGEVRVRSYKRDGQIVRAHTRSA